MPAWSRPSSTACGSMPVDAEAHEVGEPVDRVAVDLRRRRGRRRGQDARSVRRRLVGASLGQGGGQRPRRRRPSRRWPARSRSRRAGPAPGRRRRAASAAAARGARAAAPMPGGPPILWALTLSRSAPRSSKSIGTCPAAWAASTWTSTPRSRQAATTSATGWSVPTSWLPHCRWTSAVSGRIAADHLVGVDPPEAVAADHRHLVTVGGRGAPPSARWPGTTTWSPRSVAPRTAYAMASVAPLVNTTSRGRAPSSAATWSRASSTATRAGVALGVDARRDRRRSAAQPRRHGLDRLRAQRGGGGVVEVVAGHGAQHAPAARPIGALFSGRPARRWPAAGS